MGRVVFFALFLSFSRIFAQDPPLAVVIVGGGPSGLGAAIEAKSHGCNVTVIEKREQYIRPQYLFIDDRAMALLERWGVATDEIVCSDIGNGEHIWFIRICRLEKLMAEKAALLGIDVLRAEFQSVGRDHSVTAFQDGSSYRVPYDVLIGADGTHSRVREVLAIDHETLGSGFGASAIRIHSGPSENGVLLPDPIPCKEGFIKKVEIPFANIIVMQSAAPFSYQEFRENIQEQGWFTDLGYLDEGMALILTHIPVFLQKAKTFFNEELSTIVIGDAAATASFFQGEGASFSLYTAKLAGCLCDKMQAGLEKSALFQEFEQEMRKEAEFLIQDSAFLLSNSPRGRGDGEGGCLFHPALE